MAAEKKRDAKFPDEDEVLARARERFRFASEAETEIRKEALDDLQFISGEQWPSEVRRDRDLDGRPCLTINRLPQFVRQVTNDQRQNRPSIKVNPVDDAATIETAKVLQGLIRHIEYDSNAEIAYDTASDGQCRNGFGYFRITTDYCDPMSFEQDIKIKRIKNPFTVYMDPNYSEPDGSDAEWVQIVEEISSDRFKAEFPDSELCQMSDWSSIGDTALDWVTADKCKVAEYFEKTYKEVDLVLLSDGSAVRKDKLPEVLPEGISIVDERKSQEVEIKWRKHNGFEILEETVFPGKFIPIVPVLGDELIVGGKRVLESVIRHAKDSQRMYNYWASSETEMIALSPRAPYIGVEGQFEGFEEQWKTANRRNHAFLQYKAKTIGGDPAPPPQRNAIEAPVQAITQARMQAAEDLKATTGIYDASLGNRSNEQSGRAIEGRVRQAEVSNFHMTDNFARSLRHAGRIVIGVIPFVYDTKRVIRIVHEDGEQEQIAINQMFQHQGQDVYHDMSVGKYDVTVSTGPSFQTKRQETVATMMQLTKALPQVMQYGADILVGSMDTPGSQVLAERFKKMLPPQLQDHKDGQAPIPPQAQQQLAQMRAMLQQLTQTCNEQAETINTKRMDLESKERIALMQAENSLIVEQMKADASHAQTAFKLEIADIHKRLALVGQNVPIGSEPSGAQARPGIQSPPTGGLPPGNGPQGPSMGVNP